VSQVRTLTLNFTVVTLKMWAYSPQIAEIGNFWYKFDQKGYTSLSDFFIQNLAWESLPSLLSHVNFTAVALKFVGLQPPKSQKLVIFGIHFPQRGISL